MLVATIAIRRRRFRVMVLNVKPILDLLFFFCSSLLSLESEFISLCLTLSLPYLVLVVVNWDLPKLKMIILRFTSGVSKLIN